jgi:hypothetical protein
MGGLCAFALLAAGLAFAQAPEKRTVQVGGDLYLAADGTVDRVTVDEQTPAQLKPIVEAAVKQWRFEPVLRKGVPTPVRQGMVLDLEGVPADGGFKLRVTRVDFRAARLRHANLVVPQLNTRMDVLTALRVDAEGNVVDVAVLYMRSLGGLYHSALDRKQMSDAIAKGLRKSKFRPAELAYGEEADDTILLPIDYRLAGTDDPVELRSRMREMKKVPWLDASEQPNFSDDLQMAPGEAMALQSDDVKLRSDVVGKML